MTELSITRPDGARIRIRDHGGAPGLPAIVLSNSLATDEALWADVIERLRPGHRVVGYDTRGHGASTTPSASTSLAALADDLFAVMDAVGLARAHVAGISLGGMTGLQAALQAPARLQSLIACNCRASIDAAGIAGWEQRLEVLAKEGVDALATITLERWFTPAYRAEHPEAMRQVRAMIARTAPAGYEACVRAIQAIDLLDRLPQIRVPVLLVAGAQDAAAAPAVMQAMAQAIGGARCEVLDPCGHLSSIQRPAELAALITTFIATRRDLQ